MNGSYYTSIFQLSAAVNIAYSAYISQADKYFDIFELYLEQLRELSYTNFHSYPDDAKFYLECHMKLKIQVQNIIDGMQPFWPNTKYFSLIGSIISIISLFLLFVVSVNTETELSSSYLLFGFIFCLVPFLHAFIVSLAVLKLTATKEEFDLIITSYNPKSTEVRFVSSD
jgi:hypothetical protein